MNVLSAGSETSLRAVSAGRERAAVCKFEGFRVAAPVQSCVSGGGGVQESADTVRKNAKNRRYADGWMDGIADTFFRF